MDMRTGAINTLSAVDQWLATLAGNLTGSNVNGFRGQQVEFKDVLAQQIAAGSPALQNGGSAIPAEQISNSGATLAAVKTDFSQGSLQTTNQPSDLGISGNGFFILSKVRNPTSLADLVFTRNGSFHFDYFQKSNTLPNGAAGSTGEYRMVNQDGLFVMGFTSNSPSAYTANSSVNLPGSPVPPTEGAFDSSTPITGNPVSSTIGGLFGNGFQFQPITIPFQSDPTHAQDLNVGFTPKFDAKGWVADSTQNADAPLVTPTAPGGTALHEVSFVALANFADPQGLVKDNGSTNFDWNAIAGKMFLGIGGNPNDASGTPNVVGSNNTINPGTLEASNASVNTTLPELTIAQKSFSTDVKVVQVGDEMIDDVNNLVK